VGRGRDGRWLRSGRALAGIARLHTYVYDVCVATHKQHPKNAQRAAVPSLGERIRLWRIYRALTQGAVEQGAGLAHNTLSRIETGVVSPRLETLERLAAAMDVGLEELQFAVPPRVSGNQEATGDSVTELVRRMMKLSDQRRYSVLRILQTVLDELNR